MLNFTRIANTNPWRIADAHYSYKIQNTYNGHYERWHSNVESRQQAYKRELKYVIPHITQEMIKRNK